MNGWEYIIGWFIISVFIGVFVGRAIDLMGDDDD